MIINRDIQFVNEKILVKSTDELKKIKNQLIFYVDQTEIAK